ncbi:hypothetical protein IFM89_009876, partial [Coptis chinensis]
SSRSALLFKTTLIYSPVLILQLSILHSILFPLSVGKFMFFWSIQYEKRSHWNLLAGETLQEVCRFWCYRSLPMPLYKRTPFSLVETPQSLESHELVFQVRFTKEIFKDYQYPAFIREYLNRVNLYRQRLWTCKITGKTNLTYEEALVSEQLANEKVQQFPKELVAPVLQMVQFSPLKLIDIVNNICKRLQERLSEGDELYGRKDQSVCACKILKVLGDAEKSSYEVGWIDKDKNVIDHSVVRAEDLIRKKLPFTREVLKSFIRESTSRSFPWILHEKLARRYGVSTEVPEELRDKISPKGKKKRKKIETENSHGSKKKKKEDEPAEPIKYPIDDLLVQPDADDPVLTDRPTPSRDFNVPMDCVGDLLMVWDFCSSFSKLLQLSPFSLEDFQNAICHKDNNLILIVESHAAVLRLLIKERGEYFTAIHNKNRSGTITVINWTNYVCDFLEMVDVPELSTNIATIKRNQYGLLETHAKLGIFRELVSQALASDAVRELLDTLIEQQQALAATKRGEAVEEGRKRREEKELQKAVSGTKKEFLQREIEKRFVRTNSLGKDKNYNRYWFFSRDGRIFVESPDSKLWGYYSSKEEVDALIGSLNVKGVRERALQKQMDKCYDRICSAIQKRSKDIAHKIAMEEAVVRRSSRVRAPQKDSPALAFLSYVNKWKDKVIAP